MYFTYKNMGLGAIAIAMFAYLNIFTDLYFVSAIGAALFAMIFVKFVQDLGHKIEVRDLVAFLSLLQWLVGPILAYNVLPYDDLYWMDVPEETYMNYVVPACLALVIGMYFPIAKERVVGMKQIGRVKEYLIENPNVGYIITAAGFFASLLSSKVPGSLGFLFKLLGSLQFMGVYMILFGNSKIKWILFSAVLGAVIGTSVLQGMFGELMNWLLFSFLVISIVAKIPMWGKITAILFGFVLILMIQSTKEEYRKATWFATSSKSNSQIYNEILMDRLSNPSKLFDSEVLNNMGARLNQGWIIARIMGNMPINYGFVKGETVVTALYAGLVPRVLVPNKAKAGGRANFERFTGTPLPETTSMDISLMGEGYANYGVLGGIVFLFCIGTFYNWTIIKILKISENHPILILFVPMLFFDVIKAETDFATIFNYLSKSALVVSLVFWGMKNVLKINM